MHITVEFDSLEELSKFQDLVMVAGAEAPKAESKPKKAERKAPKAEQKAEEPAPAPIEKVEPTEEAEADSAPEAAPEEVPLEETISPSDLKVFAAAQSRAGYRAQLKELLNQYGEKSVTELIEHKPDRLQEFYEELKGVVNAQ